MGRAMDKWTRTACALCLLSALWACKKKDEPAPAASVSPAAQQAAEAAAAAALAQAQAAASAAAAQAAASAPAAAASAPAVAASAAPTPELGAVKRFADKEKPATGTTKVLVEASKIYDEPDATQPQVATLSKDLVVSKVATLDSGWTLIEFPSGIGKVSPAWIESKDLVGSATTPVASAKPATSAKPTASAAPATSAKPVASAAPSASAAPVTSASAAPKPRIKPGAVLQRPH